MSTPRSTDHSPCRLFVYLAAKAPVGVILRRGPTDWARLTLWRTDTDEIEHGQWIKGRVYERRSDLSDDGRLFAAFVRQSGGRQTAAGADSWIALSRPPYFTALAVWFVGGTYHTGAFFSGHDTLWLGFMEDRFPDVGSKPAGLRVEQPRNVPYVDGTANWTDRTVHFNRLRRDGWRRVDAAADPDATTWERRHPAGGATLVMRHAFGGFRRFGGPYVVTYTVVTDAGATGTIGEATWADWDHRGRLVVARDGTLGVWRDGVLDVIHDFNGQEPDPQPAPAWVTQ